MRVKAILFFAAAYLAVGSALAQSSIVPRWLFPFLSPVNYYNGQRAPARPIEKKSPEKPRPRLTPYDPANRQTPPGKLMQIMRDAIHRHDLAVPAKDRVFNNLLVRDLSSSADKIIMRGLKCANGGIIFANIPELYPSFREQDLEAIRVLLPNFTGFAPGLEIEPSYISGTITIGAALTFALPWKSLPCAVPVIDGQSRPTRVVMTLTVNARRSGDYYILNPKFQIIFDPQVSEAKNAVQFVIDGRIVGWKQFQDEVKRYGIIKKEARPR